MQISIFELNFKANLLLIQIICDKFNILRSNNSSFTETRKENHIPLFTFISAGAPTAKIPFL